MFHVGDIVIHPGHGLCRIAAIQNIQSDPLYVLKLKGKSVPGNVKILVHDKDVKSIGVRYPTTPGEIDEMMKILQEDSNDITDDSVKGYPLTKKMVQSGDLRKTAEAWRDLRRHRNSSSSLTKKSLLEFADSMIVEEIAFVRKISKKKARKLIEDALAG